MRATKKYDLTKSPFPMRLKNGRVVEDELCQCGHRRTDHNPTIEFGHGSCHLAASSGRGRSHRATCECLKFSFASFVEGQ